MKSHFAAAGALFLALFSFAAAGPRVLVLPFEPIMDSLYAPYGGKESVLNYRSTLQQLISNDLAKDTTIRVVDISEFVSYVKSKDIKSVAWNNVKLAATIASDLGADFAIIGTYGEFSRQIRLDARVVVAALADVPQGYSVTGVASVLEDIPTAASQVSDGVLNILKQGGIVRPVSKGYLFPEGNLAAFDPNGSHADDVGRLVVWANTPSPKISATPSVVFTRCSRIDRMNSPEEDQRTRSSYAADLPAGSVHLSIQQRGYLPYEGNLNIEAGKAYRLVVNLQQIERLPRQ